MEYKHETVSAIAQSYAWLKVGMLQLHQLILFEPDIEERERHVTYLREIISALRNAPQEVQDRLKIGDLEEQINSQILRD